MLTFGSSPATIFLQQSMERYASLDTYQAECIWEGRVGDRDNASTKRVIWRQKPNLFKVVSTADRDGGYVMTAISDGTHIVERTSDPSLPVLRETAPASMASATSMLMMHRIFCGSLLYHFFDGAGAYSRLADEQRMRPRFGDDVVMDGRKCETVCFWAQGLYGKTEIAIGLEDRLVYRIRYGSEPLIERLNSEAGKEQRRRMLEEFLDSPEDIAKAKMTDADIKALRDSLDSIKDVEVRPTTETYRHIVVGQPIPPTVFSTEEPENP